MKRELIAVLVPLLVLSVGFVRAEEGEPLLGDESDGSRAHPIHLIPLFPENEDGEKGEQIDPEEVDVMPFSTRLTCGECHTYEAIAGGWHFNAVDSNVPAGRSGEPWLYFSPKLGIQLPLSYRSWAGTFTPEEVGLTPFEFTKIFGRHMPGGGVGEVKATDGDGIAKQYVSGKLEVNCLACHNAHPGQDQGGVNGYAVQVSAKENFRWAATASCEFANVTGSAADASITYDPFMPDETEKNAPRVTYDKDRFDENGNVLVEVVREVPDHRCYFCHSDLYGTGSEERAEKWQADEDIHLAAGLTCVDCHRNGLYHNIVRGYEGEPSGNAMAATTTCRGCHLGNEDGERPEGGRLGAPVPTHVGIPTVHFEKLTCTACHSGPWPGDRAVLTKTARAHRLGTPNVNKDPNVLPHVLAPILAEGGAASGTAEGQIAPHKMVWPAYWGNLTEQGVKPLALDAVEKAVKGAFKDVEAPAGAGWPAFTPEQIAAALKALADVAADQAVYVAGGTLYHLDEAGELVTEADHPEAAPYMWPLAHAVRPAAQSLGIRYCTDCHATTAGFFFGSVAVDSPVASATPATKRMVDFQDSVSPIYAWAFAVSFVFRPMMKIFALGACGIIGLVLLLYGLKALGAVAKVLAEEE